jgi:hypothetical protein
MPVTEVDALRQPGSSGRVERPGTGVFIEVREIAPGDGPGKQRLIFGVERKRGLSSLSWLSDVAQIRVSKPLLNG